jgi:predicted HicB family RNase H-like nuclease
MKTKRTIEPFSIYPDPPLRRRLETIAEHEGRSLNKQIIRFLRRSADRFDQRMSKGRMAHAS